MKFNLSKIQLSRNDLRLKIKLPSEITPKLAYFLGFHYGDGYMKKEIRGKTVDYRMSYNGNASDEFEWYKKFISKLVHDLFNKPTRARRTKTGTVNIEFRSKAIFEFLHYVCGVPQSPKNNMIVPTIIKDSSLCIKKSFLRGIADTDFGVTFKPRKRTRPYPVLDYQTYDKILRDSIYELLIELNFNCVIGSRIRLRKDTLCKSYYIQISGRYMLKNWVTIIGFSNPKHLRKIEAR